MLYAYIENMRARLTVCLFCKLREFITSGSPKNIDFVLIRSATV